MACWCGAYSLSVTIVLTRNVGRLCGQARRGEWMEKDKGQSGDELISAPELAAFLRSESVLYKFTFSDVITFVMHTIRRKLPTSGSRGAHLSNAEIKAVISCLDHDQDGELNLKELDAVMRAAQRLKRQRSKR